MTDQLNKLFESTKLIYKSEAEEVLTRLLLIKNSSLLNESIKNSIDSISEKVKETTAEIGKIKENDFEGIHGLERKIRIEERILELIENAISTYISHRNLSITLSIIFEELYKEIIIDNKLPFIVVSKEGEALKTYPTLRNKKNELSVGVIGIPLFSVSHTYEWILAGHEFGHIIANKKLGANIEYNKIEYGDKREERKRKIIENYEMEILADFTAMHIFGPVFLEVLLTEFTGAEPGSEFIASPTHPPIPWRIRLCFDKASYFEREKFNEKFEEKGAREFIEAVLKVIDTRYPMTKLKEYEGYGQVKYEDMEYVLQKSFKKIRDPNRLKTCYTGAYDISEKLQNGEILPEDGIYTSDEIAIGGYLASRGKPKEFKSYTQKVTDFLIKTRKK